MLTAPTIACRRLPVALALSLLVVLVPTDLRAQDSASAGAGLPMPATRALKFTTDEATWMSLDVSPDGRTLVFDILGDLYTLPIAGGTATRITSGTAWDSHPRFSPDGKQIVFASDRSGAENLWLADADGRNARALTKGDRQGYSAPAWTPDGSAIVATRRAGFLVSDSELWLYPVRGGAGIRLTAVGRLAHGAAFTADPRYLYFAAIPGAANTPPPSAIIQHQIFMLDRTTGRVSQRTGHSGGAIRPALSRDGKWLAYVGGDGEAGTAIILRDVESGDERVLVPSALWSTGGRTSDYMPGSAFTPDGQAFVTSLGGKLWRVEVPSGRRTLIPFTAEVDQRIAELVRTEHRLSDSTLAVRQIRDPRVAPDNRHVVFSALDRLWIADLAEASPAQGGVRRVVPRRLTTSDIGEFSPTWSRDGRWIVYVTWSDSSGGDVMRVRPTLGAVPERLSASRAFYDKPVFSLDGARVVVERGTRQTRVNWRDEQLRAQFRDVDLVWLSTDCTAVSRPVGAASLCGTPHVIAPISFPANFDGLPGGAQFVVGDERLYAYDGVDGLVSMQWDGSDRRSLLKMTGYSWNRRDQEAADEILIAPNGQRALANVRSNLYLVDLAPTGGDAPTIMVSSLAASPLPVTRVTDVGGSFPSFSADGTRAYWSLGHSLFIYDLARADSQTRAERVDIVIETKKDRPRGVVALRGARIVTMRGNEVIPNGDIVVTDNRITAVGASGTVAIPAGARSIDMGGKTILPGYVDIHAHMWTSWGVHRTQPWEYLVNLAYGVTTTRDPQTMSTDVITLGDMVETGAMLGPRILSTSRGIFGGDNIASMEEARRIVRRYGEFYGTGMIKQYMVGDRKHRQWINMAAKELGLNTTTEAGGDYRMTMSLMLDGYSGTEHAIGVFPLYKDVARLVATSGITYTPTLIVSADLEGYFNTRTDPYADSVLTRFTPRWELDDRLQRSTSWMREGQMRFPKVAAAATTLLREGGHIGFGSHGNRQGLGAHWELWGLARGGMPNHEILRAATSVSAEAIGVDRDVGSIEAGKMADLQVLDRDPLADIRNSTSIRYVMKNGRLYEAATLTEIWPRQKPLTRLWWEVPIANGGQQR